MQQSAVPGRSCANALPETCVWQCAVKVHAFFNKCARYVRVAGPTTRFQKDFGQQLGLLQQTCMEAVDVDGLQATVNAAQCAPEGRVFG